MTDNAYKLSVLNEPKIPSTLIWILVLVQFSALILSGFNVIYGLLFTLPIFTALFVFIIGQNPLWGLYLLLFSTLLGPLSNLPLGDKIPQLNFADLVLFLILIPLYFRIMTRTNFLRIRFYTIERIYILFLLYCILNIMLAFDVLRAIALFKNYLVGWIVFEMVLHFVDDKSKLLRFFWILLLWGGILSIYQIIFMLAQGDLIATIQRKYVHLSFGSSNYIAAFYVLLLSFSIPMIFSKISNALNKALLYGLILLMISSLFLTGSRGGVVALFAGLVVILIKFRNWKTLTAFSFFLAVLGVAIYYNPSSQFVFKGLADYQQSVSVLSRLELWLESYRIFTEHPIFGVGLGNVDFFIHLRLEEAFYTKAHNIILELLSETGIIGFGIFHLLFIAILFQQIKNIKQIKDHDLNLLAWGFLSASVASYAHALFEPTITTFFFGIIFWIVMGLSLKLQSISQTTLANG